MTQVMLDDVEIDYRRRPQASSKPFVIEARLKEPERQKRLAQRWGWNYRMEWTEAGRYASERDRTNALRTMVRKDTRCDFRTVDKGII
jgi:hypothetical protein